MDIKAGSKVDYEESKKKYYLDTDLMPFIKINSKQVTDLNVKLKLQEDNIGGNLDDVAYGDIFLDRPSKAPSTKEIAKLDINKPKNFSSSKENVKRMRRQAWEKIFADDTSNKGLLSKTYKKTLKTEQ